MSSSSSATSGAVAELLAESLKVLAEEVPAAHERMCARLAGKAVQIHVDEERFVVEIDEGGAGARIVRAGEGLAAEALIETSKRAIADVIDARCSLAEAVLAGDVNAVAPLHRLVDILAGLSTYVHGAVRCPSFPRLLERFRALCAGLTET